MSRVMATMGQRVAGSLEWMMVKGEEHHDLLAAAIILITMVAGIAAIAQ